MSTLEARMQALGAGPVVDVSKISTTTRTSDGRPVSADPRPTERQVQLG